MNKGVIQQFGTPDEIFDDPANQFVADFVGEPGINLVPGTVSRDNGHLLVRVGDGSLIPAATTPAEGTEVMVGLRPQDCVTSGPADLRGEVTVFEDLLEFGQATVRVPGVEKSIVVQTPAEESYRPGDEIAISAPAERIYLFDATTGDRLR